MVEEVKKAIHDLLKTSEDHPTTEEMFKKIKLDLPGVDQDVFLNGLADLEKEGMISYMLSSVDEVRHYDKNPRAHHHFICERCGSVRDVPISDEAIQVFIDHAQMIINSFAKISQANLSFQGICHTCRTKFNNYTGGN